MNDPSPPIACNLSSPELAARLAELRSGLLVTALAVESLESGYRWTFAHSPTLLAELGVLVDGERTCCPFLSFVIRVAPAGGETSLEVTGPQGTRDVLAPWLKPASSGTRC